MAPATATIATLHLDDALVARLGATHTLVAWSARRETQGSALPIVISAFHDDAALLSGADGADGVVASLAAGAIHVTTGLHGRAAVEHVSREHARRGQHLVAAPFLVFRGANDTGSAVLGGTVEAIAKVESVFAAIGTSIVARCERPADAALLATTHAALMACAMEAIAEALALVRKYGVDPIVMRDVMSDALFAGTVYGPIADAMLTGVNSDAPSAARGVHILDLALGAASATHVPLPSIDVCRDRLLSAIARGDGERAWTVVAREQARASGLE